MPDREGRPPGRAGAYRRVPAAVVGRGAGQERPDRLFFSGGQSGGIAGHAAPWIQCRDDLGHRSAPQELRRIGARAASAPAPGSWHDAHRSL